MTFLTSDSSDNQYLQKCTQKQERNRIYLKELGLTTIKEKTKRKRQNVNDESKKRKQNDTPITPTRRSPRKANKPALYDGSELDQASMKIDSVRVQSDDNGEEENDLIQEESRKAHVAKMMKRRIKRRQMDIMKNNTLPDQRKLLENLPDEEWTEDMQRYFREIVNNSDTNVERVMRIVNKLVAGNGVNHAENRKAWFRKNVKIRLSDNFQAMYNEASEWVEENGGDRGHGWLIEHPIKKLWVYQCARVENTGAFFTGDKP
jgi:hypothetical protein